MPVARVAGGRGSASSDNIRRADVLLDAISPATRSARDGAGRGLDAPTSVLARAACRAAGRSTLDEIKRSNLRGRGGAGFTTGLKWEAVPQARRARARYVVCNADEGEPGTFKDRVLLTRYADLVFEGMTIARLRDRRAPRACSTCAANTATCWSRCSAVLQRRRDAEPAGRGHPAASAGFDFDIEIHVGAGAYVCGEESALIESLEGKRGTPRNRPPFPVDQRLPAASRPR
ncbi:MAG: hypothetical protein MZW92_16215 [Comamonadaceae bacterium]|nr:hypothetical protein [Comamonadaceae bacterium]